MTRIEQKSLAATALLLLFTTEDHIAVKAHCLPFIYRPALASCQAKVWSVCFIYNGKKHTHGKEKRPAKGKAVCVSPADVQVVEEKAGFTQLICSWRQQASSRTVALPFAAAYRLVTVRLLVPIQSPVRVLEHSIKIRLTFPRDDQRPTCPRWRAQRGKRFVRSQLWSGLNAAFNKDKLWCFITLSSHMLMKRDNKQQGQGSKATILSAGTRSHT